MLRVRCRFLLLSISCCCLFFLAAFFFIATATTEIYTLSLHDALPIFAGERPAAALADDVARGGAAQRASGTAFPGGSLSFSGFGTGRWRSISSSTISSGVRSHPSSSRSRPDSAATAEIGRASWRDRVGG